MVSPLDRSIERLLRAHQAVMEEDEQAARNYSVSLLRADADSIALATPAAHPVLFITKLLSAILSRFNATELTLLTRVCKSWHQTITHSSSLCRQILFLDPAPVTEYITFHQPVLYPAYVARILPPVVAEEYNLDPLHGRTHTLATLHPLLARLDFLVKCKFIDSWAPVLALNTTLLREALASSPPLGAAYVTNPPVHILRIVSPHDRGVDETCYSVSTPPYFSSAPTSPSSSSASASASAPSGPGFTLGQLLSCATRALEAGRTKPGCAPSGVARVGLHAITLHESQCVKRLRGLPEEEWEDRKAKFEHGEGENV